MLTIRILGLMLVPLLLTADQYTESIKAWQEHREQGLRKPDSWLSLVGLFWLKPGRNTIGSAPDNDFVLPPKSAPAHAGVLVFSQDGKSVTFETVDAIKGKKDLPRKLSYVTEEQEASAKIKPDVVKLGSASFFVIARNGRLAIRATDSQSPTLLHFAGLQFYPVNATLHFHAKFVPAEKSIPILNVLGTSALQTSPGYVEFSYRGTTYHLRPIYEGKTLFFLYRDPTNRTTTYQAGRMLNTPLPENGLVDLDLNRSYNPPCTFTPYATCPLPPRENTLAFPVEAGEKRYGKGHPDVETK